MFNFNQRKRVADSDPTFHFEGSGSQSTYFFTEKLSFVKIKIKLLYLKFFSQKILGGTEVFFQDPGSESIFFIIY